jgi:endonuclease/exonuclease/phosphatase family metal-dependent hydrolase
VLIIVTALALAAACWRVWETQFRKTHYVLEKERSVPAICPADGGFSVLTFNAALAPGLVSYSTPRKPNIIAGIRDFRDTDVICLQEVWKEEDARAVMGAIGRDADRTYWEDTSERNHAAGTYVCEKGLIEGKLGDCFREHCAGPDVAIEDQSSCVAHHCRTIGTALLLVSAEGRRCLVCLGAMAGHPVGEIIKTCEGPVGASRVHGGHNGVILSSRWPLRNRQTLHLEASGANRVALIATIDIPGRGPIEIACTHLTAPHGGIPPFQTGYATWHEEQAAQVRAISEALAMRASDGRAQLLVGDLNAGPNVKGTDLAANQDLTYKLVEDMGFRCPALDAKEPYCTVCRGNTMRSAGAASHHIDHACVRGGSLTAACARQVLHETRETNLLDGTRRMLHPSDHAGSFIKFEFNIR